MNFIKYFGVMHYFNLTVTNSEQKKFIYKVCVIEQVLNQRPLHYAVFWKQNILFSKNQK